MSEVINRVERLRDSLVIERSYYIGGQIYRKRDKEYVTFINCIRNNGYDDTVVEVYGGSKKESLLRAELILQKLNEG